MQKNSISDTNANRRNLSIRWSIIHHVFAFLSGASLLVLLSIGQKIMIDASLFILQGYLVPVLIGGCGGLLLSIWRRKSQQAYVQLQESEASYRMLIEDAADGIFTLDMQGRFVEVNPYTCTMLGYSRAELLQLTMHDMAALPDQQSAIPQRFAELSVGQRWIRTRQIRRKDGSVLTADISGVRLPNDHFMAIVRDVTERDKAEEALRESEEKYRLLTETAQDLILTHDFDGRITHANKAAINITGYSESEILQLNLRDVLSEEQLLEAQARHKQRISGQRSILHYETAILTAQGQIVPLEISSVTLMKQGEPFGILVIGHDITERKKAESALRESEERLRTLINATPDIICFKDGQGRWLEANQADLHLFELEDVNYSGKTDKELAAFSPFYSEAFLTCEASDEKAWESKGISRINEIIPTPSGIDKVYDVIKVPLFHEDGRRKGLIVLGRDITEKRQAENALRLAQKTESLGILAGGIAHDFNNLLVAMLGQMSLAQAKLSDENPAHPHIEKAVKAADRAADLTRQMLAYSGRGHFETRHINLNNLIAENLHLFQTSMPKNVELRSELADSLPLIEADTGQMQQVIMNLIINGAQAIEDKQGYVVVMTGTQILDEEDGRYTQHTGQKLPPGQYVTLEIHDNGCGMSPDMIPKIFDPFFSTKEKGHGLGLAAVLGIMRGHNGGLYVYSEVNKGTIFKLLFPVNQDTTTQPTVSHPNAQEFPSQKCVLVIDDETAVREAVADILELRKIEVIAAPDGASGIALYQERMDDVGLVLLDLSMPGMDGGETFRELRQINPDVRVILSSGYNQVEATRHFTGKGLTAFIQKPYKANDLIETVKQHMQ